MARKFPPLLLATCGALAVGMAGCASTPEPRGAEATATTGTAVPELEGGTEIQRAAWRALGRLSAAQDALERQQATSARPLVDAAIEDVQALESSLPGEELLAALEETASSIEANPGGADFGRLRSLVQERRAELDPAVTRAVEDARFALLAGNPDGAVSRLRDAGVALGADSQRLPVTHVREQLEQARELLRNRDIQAARRQLVDVRSQLERIQASAPLVPVRWNLRAAAEAAEGGAWDRAERYLADTVQALESMREAQEQAPVPGIDQMESRARAYLERIDGGQRPTADQLRELASSTLDVRAG